MAEKTMRQTTLRVEEDLLLQARYFLNKERLSINDFVVESLKAYLAKQTEKAPQREQQPA